MSCFWSVLVFNPSICSKLSLITPWGPVGPPLAYKTFNESTNWPKYLKFSILALQMRSFRFLSNFSSKSGYKVVQSLLRVFLDIVLKRKTWKNEKKYLDRPLIRAQGPVSMLICILWYNYLNKSCKGPISNSEAPDMDRILNLMFKNVQKLVWNYRCTEKPKFLTITQK